MRYRIAFALLGCAACGSQPSWNGTYRLSWRCFSNCSPAVLPPDEMRMDVASTDPDGTVRGQVTWLLAGQSDGTGTASAGEDSTTSWMQLSGTFTDSLGTWDIGANPLGSDRSHLVSACSNPNDCAGLWPDGSATVSTFALTVDHE